jgi:hypothetical protein
MPESYKDSKNILDCLHKYRIKQTKIYNDRMEKTKEYGLISSESHTALIKIKMVNRLEECIKSMPKDTNNVNQKEYLEFVEALFISELTRVISKDSNTAFPKKILTMLEEMLPGYSERVKYIASEIQLNHNPAMHAKLEENLKNAAIRAHVKPIMEQKIDKIHDTFSEIQEKISFYLEQPIQYGLNQQIWHDALSNSKTLAEYLMIFKEMPKDYIPHNLAISVARIEKCRREFDYSNAIDAIDAKHNAEMQLYVILHDFRSYATHPLSKSTMKLYELVLSEISDKYTTLADKTEQIKKEVTSQTYRYMRNLYLQSQIELANKFTEIIANTMPNIYTNEVTDEHAEEIAATITKAEAMLDFFLNNRYELTTNRKNNTLESKHKLYGGPLSLPISYSPTYKAFQDAITVGKIEIAKKLLMCLQDLYNINVEIHTEDSFTPLIITALNAGLNINNYPAFMEKFVTNITRIANLKKQEIEENLELAINLIKNIPEDKEIKPSILEMLQSFAVHTPSRELAQQLLEYGEHDELKKITENITIQRRTTEDINAPYGAMEDINAPYGAMEDDQYKANSTTTTTEHRRRIT